MEDQRAHRIDESRFQRELLSRLPLAEAVLALFSHVLSEPFLNGLFEAHRGRCYERALHFPALVYLVRDALLVHDGSGRQSFVRAEESGTLPVAVASAYGKLSRLPVPLSEALLEEGARRLAALMPEGKASRACEVPASLSAFEVVVIDGKKIKNAAKRMKPCRGLPGALLGPKLLVALPLRGGLASAMAVAQDGESNDVPLVPALLPRVRAQVAGPVLWVADRQFCDLNLPGLFTAREGDHFLVRFTKKMHFHPDPARLPEGGSDARGRRFVQEWGWIGGKRDERRRYVRRVTLTRAAEGEDDIAVVTDLTDGRLYPAQDLLEVYLMRWGIERVFQQVTEVFGLKKLIGAGPRAMAFQAALCLLLYDMVQLAKAYAAQAGGVEAQRVSGEQLFYDAAHELIAWAKAGDPAHAAAHLRTPPSPPRLREQLARWIGSRWTPRWLKALNKNPCQKRPPAKRSGAHTSVWRVLQGQQRC